MDRELSHQFPQMQIEFIDAICAPVYKVGKELNCPLSLVLIYMLLVTCTFLLKLISRVCVKLQPLLDGCMANRDCWNSLAKGESVKEESMRIPGESEGADANFRERLMALLHVPSTSTTPSVEGTQAADAAHAPEFPTSSMSTNSSGEDDANVTSATTVGGGAH